MQTPPLMYNDNNSNSIKKADLSTFLLDDDFPSSTNQRSQYSDTLDLSLGTIHSPNLQDNPTPPPSANLLYNSQSQPGSYNYLSTSQHSDQYLPLGSNQPRSPAAQISQGGYPQLQDQQKHLLQEQQQKHLLQEQQRHQMQIQQEHQARQHHLQQKDVQEQLQQTAQQLLEQQRIQQNKIQQDQLEQQRIQQMKIQQEQLRQEQVRQEQVRLEQARQEQAKQELRNEQVRQEQLRQEQAKQQEQSRHQEQLRLEQARQLQLQQEQQRQQQQQQQEQQRQQQQQQQEQQILQQQLNQIQQHLLQTAQQQQQLTSGPNPATLPVVNGNVAIELPKRINSTDSVQGLLEAYPNPQNDSRKIMAMLETLMRKFDEHSIKVERTLTSFDKRLTTLESNTKDGEIKGAHGNSGSTASRDSDRSNSSKKKSKPKTRITPPPKPSKDTKDHVVKSSQVQHDEELARQLQAQFNQEEHGGSVKEGSQLLTDEDYAQRLQAAYLRREYDAAKKKTAGKKKDVKKDSPKKEDKKIVKEEDPKPTLWSRLFGVKPEDELSDSDDEKDKFTLKKKKDSKKVSDLGKKKSDSSAITSQIPPLPYYYPQSPFLVNPAAGNQGSLQYMPFAGQPGQYYLTNQ